MSEVRIDDSSDKRSTKLREVLNEFYQKQAGFHDSMNNFVLKISPVSQLLTGEDKKWFQIYVEPYKNLCHNSFKDPGLSQDVGPRLLAIINGGKQAEKEYELRQLSGLPNTGPALNKIYLEFKDNELIYQVKGVKDEQKITRAQFEEVLGPVTTAALFKAFEKNTLAAIQPFQEAILSVTGARGHTQQYESDFQFTKLLQDELDAMQRAVFNFGNFSNFLLKIKELPNVKKNEDAANAVQAALGVQAIIPVQYGPRYRLLLAEILKYLPASNMYQPGVAAVADKINVQLQGINDHLKKYQDKGMCYLVSSDEIPVKYNAHDKIEGNLDALEIPIAAFVRVKNKDIDQLYYVNREDRGKEQVVLLADMSRGSQDRDLLERFDSKIKLESESPKSKSKSSTSQSSEAANQAVDRRVKSRQMGSKELDFIESLNVHVHKAAEGDEVKKESERRFDKFRASLMSGQQLQDLMQTLQTYVNEQIRVSKVDCSVEKLIDLIQKLKNILAEEMPDNARMKLVRDEIMQPYADIYVDEREKNWRGGTNKGKALSFFEKTLEEFNLVSAQGLQDESVSRLKDTPDARIFRGFEYSPESCTLAAEHLFTRAMAEGISGEQDLDVYVNARKAINRMGTHAINRWNELILQTFDANVDPSLFIAGSSVALEDESKIRTSYRKTVEKPEIKETVDKVYYIRILVNLLEERFPNKELMDRLEALEKKEKLEKVDVSAFVHRAVMEDYINASLMSKGAGLFGGSQKEINLGKMQNVLCEFQRRCGNELFGPLNFKQKITDKIMHETVLHSVAASKEESYDFARQVFEHAMRAGFMLAPTVNSADKVKAEAMCKKIYVNDVRAVINMGETAIKAWNELAVKSSPNPRVWANLLIQSTNRLEPSIEKLHASLSKNPAFLSYAKQRRGLDAEEVEVSQLDSVSRVQIHSDSGSKREQHL